MQHFITLYDVAYESFKTFRTNLAWQSNKDVTGGGRGGDFKNKSKGMQNAVPLCQYNNKTNDQHFICMFILQVIICIYLSLQEIKQTFVSLYLVFSLFHTAFVKKFNPPVTSLLLCHTRFVRNVLKDS